MFMERRMSYMVIAAILISLSVAASSCSMGRYLKTESAAEQEITGVYTLILYGGRSANDLRTMAILAKEGIHRPSFEVFAPEFDYKVVTGVTAKEAVEKAEKFVSFHHNFWRIQLSKIVDDKGDAIGYEVRPLYRSLGRNQSDIFDVNYKMSDGKVIVYIRDYEYPDTRLPFEGGRMSSPK
jgi:hypothetical protein